jgi:DNA-binding XRE family transcriptional regulator
VIDVARLARPWKEIKRELLQDPEFRKAYENLEPEFQAARSIIALRTAKRVTQAEMARRARIQRPMLSRLENAKEFPTIPTLARLAAALRVKIEVRFVDRHNRDIKRVPAIRIGGRLAGAIHGRDR